MKCNRCDNEATVHELRVAGGVKQEKHLCERCAQEEGVAALASPEAELLSKFVTAAGKGAAIQVSRESALACPSCGTEFARFRQSGLVGCSDCYTAFQEKLGPLLERAHEGGTHHVGKAPRRALARARGGDPEAILGDLRQRSQRISLLRKQLEQAVAMEQYERAARIRDELRNLSPAAPLEDPLEDKGGGHA